MDYFGHYPLLPRLADHEAIRLRQQCVPCFGLPCRHRHSLTVVVRPTSDQAAVRETACTRVVEHRHLAVIVKLPKAAHRSPV